MTHYNTYTFESQGKKNQQFQRFATNSVSWLWQQYGKSLEISSIVKYNTSTANLIGSRAQWEIWQKKYQMLQLSFLIK